MSTLTLENNYVPGHGYLARTVRLPRTTPSEAEIEDGHGLDEIAEQEDSTIASAAHEVLTCRQYVVYSPTYAVPAFYFTLHDSTGSPLPLSVIVDSALFRRQSLPSPDGNTFGVVLPDSSLALLSQGDHPTLGTPSWYFHPCHTSEVVGEILSDPESIHGGDELLRWMEVWFMVMGNIVDFFAGSQCDV
ncbi:hypothetical protein ACG7TL_003565 [Trametes sanguinea]